MPRRQNAHYTINEVKFLGQWVMPEGATPIAEKLRSVHDWEPRNSVKDVMSFLGYANYYHRFVYRYAGIASPLTLLTKKNIEWHWGPIQRRAFSELNFALCNVTLLIFPDPKLPYIVVADAAAHVVGGVFMQDKGDDRRPMAFMSRALKPTKQWYSAYEKEVVAIYTTTSNGDIIWRAVQKGSKW